MKRKLKITNEIATEELEPVPRSSNVRIKGSDSLKLNDQDKFLNFRDIFRINKDKFYYSLTAYCSRDKHLKTEIGIGHLEKDGKDTILVRDEPYNFFENGKAVSHAGPFEFCEVDSQHVANTHIPVDIFEYLTIEPYTFVYSNSKGFPQVVQLKNDSIIARLDDEVRCLTFKELAEILNGYTK